MYTLLTTAQKQNVRITRDSEFTGSPRWEVISGHATVAPTSDGLSATITCGPDAVQSVIEVTALPAGGAELKDKIGVNADVTASNSLKLVGDEPVRR
jgi:hypothetical protein